MDSDDCLLAQEAWEEIKSENELRFVHDEQEVLDYVYHHGAYSEPQSSPRPGIILLDLNMPKKNGHEVLTVLKTDPQLHTIPIVVFTTTKNSDEIFRAYKEGANAFMTKPTSYEGFRNTLLAVDHYWLHLVQLPSPRNSQNISGLFGHFERPPHLGLAKKSPNLHIPKHPTRIF